MGILTKRQINLILDLIREKHGPGYSDDKDISRLQVTLSMMLASAPGD